MKYSTDTIEVRTTNKYTCFYAGSLLLHKIRRSYCDHPSVEGNKLCVVGRDGKTRSYPLSQNVIYELTKLQRKVLIEKNIIKVST